MEPPEIFEFPFPPYKAQEEFMKTLYWALEEKKLGIFESPTGTGKSLALICGAVRWLRDHEAREQAAAEAASTELSRQEAEFRELFGDVIEPESSSAPQGDDADLIADFHSDEEAGSSDEGGDGDGEAYHGTQIIYTSRTHSQLSQFVGEVRRSPHAGHVRVAALASRPQLCINDAVRRLGSLGLVNQACLDMQQKSTSKTTKVSKEDGRSQKKQKATGACPYKRRVDDLAMEILSEVRDIEQLVKEGRRRKACPYYASRRAVRDAQLVVVPYNNLLHSGTRAASGLRLADSVVIVDEAHNLLETISSIHSCQLARRQVADACDQLLHYIDNLSRADGTGKAPPAAAEETRVLQLNDFLCGAGIDNLNLRKLQLFAEKIRLVQKFLRELQQPAAAPPAAPVEPAETDSRSSDMPLMATLQLINALSEPDRDCRLLITTARAEPPSIKYLALNAAAQFQSIVREARAVILAGGTMQPVSEFRDQLLVAAGAAPERVTVFSCGHVVPADQLLTLSLAAGPSGAELLFSYQSRAQRTTLDELGRVLLNLCKLIPAGIVCFLPSYDYAAAALAHFASTGVMDKISARKQVFREPRQSSRSDAVLAEYTQAVRSGQRPPAATGAILFCVVGGKMSEGINFSDDLGRCVVVVGLPYPNAKSPELMEKMRFLDANMKRSEDGRAPGQVLYENLCMKAVNQSIGRAIRHRNDYACVVLCDARYGRASVAEGLPEWIRRGLQHHGRFGPAFGQIRQFFTTMQEKFRSS
ncbi:ATP-dependent DNA helicase DDX11-like [Pollicipes pollicipes]|uniref:ATP-dependent DNA helicase DDX11-like n=1 Tax=Pollicipes pollicipes TaxID=41117 RepID=UPI001884B0F8|nr:ATP-dependent DNA helicase DDX11-like [Pollicipes pollicipes]